MSQLYFALVLATTVLLPGENLESGRKDRTTREGIDSATAIHTAAQHLASLEQRRCTPRTACCRVCSQGKACGDSCINRHFNCHQSSGCACDEADVCD